MTMYDEVPRWKMAELEKGVVEGLAVTELFLDPTIEFWEAPAGSDHFVVTLHAGEHSVSFGSFAGYRRGARLTSDLLYNAVQRGEDLVGGYGMSAWAEL